MPDPVPSVPDEPVKVAGQALFDGGLLDEIAADADAGCLVDRDAHQDAVDAARAVLSAVSEAGWVRTHEQCGRAEAERDQHRAEEQIIYGWCRRLDLPLMSPPRAPEAIDALGREVLRARAQAEAAMAECVDLVEKLARVRAHAAALAGAIDDYLLWEPGRKGHAAAHRRLCDTLRAFRESQEADRAA